MCTLCSVTKKGRISSTCLRARETAPSRCARWMVREGESHKESLVGCVKERWNYHRQIHQEKTTPRSEIGNDY